MVKKLVVTITSLAGTAFLLASAFMPWFEVPAGSNTPAGCVLVKAQPWAAPYFQAGVFALGLILLGSRFLRWHHRKVEAILLPACGVCLLFFPYCVMVWDPPIAAASSWLRDQHENLVWLGGDLPTSQEYRRQWAKYDVYVVDASRDVEVCNTGHMSPVKEGWGVVPQLVVSLGYDNPFCEFAGPGWGLAILGIATSLLALLGQDLKAARRRDMLCGMGVALALFVVLLLGALSPLVRGRAYLDRATRATWSGDYAHALECLERAGVILPVLRENSAYVAQSGLLHYRLGFRDTPEALVYLASWYEEDSRSFEAESIWLNVLERGGLPGAIRRECLRALLRRAIHDLNSGQTDHAAELLERILMEAPASLKANYALQLAYLRTERCAELHELVERMHWIYACFQVPTVHPVLATGHENLCLAQYRQEDASGAYASWQRIRKPCND